jgi:hypothetical protein
VLKRAATARNEIRGLLYSLNAVVDHDGDRAHGDGEYRHADQDGPNTSTAIADDGAKHEPIWAGGSRSVKLASALTLTPPNRMLARTDSLMIGAMGFSPEPERRPGIVVGRRHCIRLGASDSVLVAVTQNITHDG